MSPIANLLIPCHQVKFQNSLMILWLKNNLKTLTWKYNSWFVFINHSINNFSKDHILISFYKMIPSPQTHPLLNSKIQVRDKEMKILSTKSKDTLNNTFTQKTIGIGKRNNSNFYNKKTSSSKTKSINFNQGWDKSSCKLTGSNITH